LIALISHVAAAAFPQAALLHCCSFAAIAGTVGVLRASLETLGQVCRELSKYQKVARLLAPLNP